MIDVESNGIAPLTGTLKGTIQMIGDKSISHRAIIMGALAHGTTQIANLLESEDVLRTIKVFREMGAIICGENGTTNLPLTIKGTPLKGIHYAMQVNSAQVKSSLLLAGLSADGKTGITEKDPTRNHTEIMLQAFGAHLKVKDKNIIMMSDQELHACSLHIPGDISSASFWLVAGLIVPGSRIRLNNVGLNASRTGILDVLEAMGANVQYKNIKMGNGERKGDLLIEHQSLKGVVIEGELIPRLIDEIPIIALFATQVEGKTVIRDAEELKVKETDRIEAVVTVLSAMGANISATEDGMIIEGETSLTGASVSAYGDHRMAMMIVIASLIAKNKTTIDDTSSIPIPYPGFLKIYLIYPYDIPVKRLS